MLPKNLRYGNKVESAPSKSYRSNIQPQNGTGPYSLGDTITINIPTRANLVLATTESVLKFNIKLTAAAANAYRWDSCGAHGIIQRIRVWHGSNLLQDIDNYGLLAKMLFDIQVPTDATYGKFNITSGTRNDLVLNSPIIATADGVDAATTLALANAIKTKFNNTNFSCNQINSGEAFLNATNTATKNIFANNEISVDTTYCINLISLIGSLCSNQYFPLFACTSAPLRVEIQLVDTLFKGLCSISNTATTFALSNVEYIGNFIELSDVAMGMIQQSLQGQPLQFVIPDYRNYGGSYTTVVNTGSQYNFPIPAKFSSLKSLFVTIRDKGTGAATFFPYSCVTNGLTDYYFRVGSQIMPTKVPNTIQEQFIELVKAIGSVSDLNHHPSIEKFSYSLLSSVANSVVIETGNASNISSGSFYIGIDLENYANSNKESIYSGYNSNTDDIFAVLNFGATTTAAANRIDSFALFDEVIIFENSTCFVRY